jgi:LysM repeat protein
MKIRNKRTGEIIEVSEEELGNYNVSNSNNINLNLPQMHRKGMNPIGYNAFLANDRNNNIFVGGGNARYQNEDFSVGPYAMGVGNKHFQKFPADYGISGTYHVNDKFDINMNVGKNSKGVGIRYKFKKGGGDEFQNKNNNSIQVGLNGLDNEQAYFRSPFQPKSESMFPLGMMNTNVQGSTEMPNLFGNQSGFDIMKQDYSNVQSSKPKRNIFENFGLREFNGIIDGVTAMANSHTDYQNRRDEMAKLAEFYQQPANPNFDRDGRSSMPMYFKNGGYNVKKGDSLEKISKEIGVPIKTLMSLNSIKNADKIKAGVTLKLPTSVLEQDQSVDYRNPKKDINPAPWLDIGNKKPIIKASGSASLKKSKSNDILEQLNTTTKGNPVINHFGKQMVDNGNKLFLTDRGNKTVYYDDGTGHLKQTVVVTGKNDNPHNTSLITHDEALAYSKTHDRNDTRRNAFITPLGATGLQSDPNYYGHPALAATNPSHRNILWHGMPNKVQTAREGYMKTKTLNDNAQTMGCINCDRPTIHDVTNIFGKNDSAYIIDSRMPLDFNKKAFEKSYSAEPIKQKKWWQFKNGGGEKEIQGLPFKSPLASAIVERGEAVQFGNRDIAMVADEGPYIEDHGDKHDGTYLPDVRRVLENTSTKKGRNHKSDMLLAMSSDEVEAITGFKPKGKRSHAQAYDEALKFYQDEQDKINSKKEKVMKQSNLSDAQMNALRLNDMFGSMAPTSESLFESLFGHQEEVKAQHGISNDEPLKFQVGGGRASSTLPNYLKPKSNNSGYHDWIKKQLGNIPTSQPSQSGKKPIVFKQSAKSANAPLNSNNFQAMQTAPIKIAGIGAGDNPQYSSEFGSFVPPYTDGNKPNWYDNSADVWNDDLYPYAQQYMGMPGFNDLSPQSRHSQYQNFVAQQYGPLVLDAYRSGIMPLNNSHMQLAASLGKQPKDLTDEEILKGYQDDKQNVRGVFTQRITDPQGRDEIKRNFRPVNFNGKTMYVEQNPEGNMPITYYDVEGELSTLGIPPYQVEQSQTNPAIGEVNNPNVQSNETRNQNVQDSSGQSDSNGNSLSNNKKQFGKNRVPLEWNDLLSPISALVNASGRYPEMPFRADINQLNYNLLDPQSQLNEITAQTRPALKDASNDSVGQAMKAQLLSNANRAKSDVIGNMMNANSQILNHQTDYNTTAKDKQSVMDATAAQDFHNRVLQSKSKQDEAILSSIDSFGKMVSKNKQFNNVLRMLDTDNFGYDPETKGIAFNNAMTYLTGNSANVTPYENPMGNTKTKSKKTLSVRDIALLNKMQTENPQQYANNVLQLKAQGYELP